MDFNDYRIEREKISPHYLYKLRLFDNSATFRDYELTSENNINLDNEGHITGFNGNMSTKKGFEDTYFCLRAYRPWDRGSEKEALRELERLVLDKKEFKQLKSRE